MRPRFLARWFILLTAFAVAVAVFAAPAAAQVTGSSIDTPEVNDPDRPVEDTSLPVFSDVGRDHPAYEAILWAAGTRLTVGYPDGTFRPELALIRRHAVVFTQRLYDDILKADSSPRFNRGDMMRVLHAIATTGDDESGVSGASIDNSPEIDDPDRPVRDTRVPTFPDVDKDHPAFAAVEWAYATGVTVGYDDGTFRPQTPLSRAHAVTFMERFYDDILKADRSEQFTRGDMMVVVYSIYNDDADTTGPRPPNPADIEGYTEWTQSRGTAVSKANLDGVVGAFACYRKPMHFGFDFLSTVDFATTTLFSEGLTLGGTWVANFWDLNDGKQHEILPGGARMELYSDTGMWTADDHDGDAILNYLIANPDVLIVDFGVYHAGGYHFVYSGEWDFSDLHTHMATRTTMGQCGYL